MGLIVEISLKQLIPASFMALEKRLTLISINIPLRRGFGIGRGRPEVNSVLLEEICSLCTRMETMEIDQRRTSDEGDASGVEESSEEEEEEENETTKVIKMLEKIGGKLQVESPTYEGSVNVEKLMDWIR